MSKGYVRRNNQSKSYVLKTELKNRAMCDIQDNDTRRSYRQSIDVFIAYAKEHQINDVTNITVDELNKYSQYLVDRGYSPATVHTRLAPICKSARINMREVDHPRRTITSIKRGRGGDLGERGRREEQEERFARLVQAQKSIGIRRTELEKLTKEDLVRDESGYLCVHVARGKGGKKQLQRILPKNEAHVKSIFDALEPGQLVFAKNEMDNHINLHGMRAQVAKESYRYYEERLKNEPGYRDQLIQELKARFSMYHRGGDAALKKFVDDFSKSNGQYLLRGESKKLAMENGLPVKYDRLALMALSVFFLSHWRLDVSVTNYVLAIMKGDSDAIPNEFI